MSIVFLPFPYYLQSHTNSWFQEYETFESPLLFITSPFCAGVDSPNTSWGFLLEPYIPHLVLTLSPNLVNKRELFPLLSWISIHMKFLSMLPLFWYKSIKLYIKLCVNFSTNNFIIVHLTMFFNLHPLLRSFAIFSYNNFFITMSCSFNLSLCSLHHSSSFFQFPWHLLSSHYGFLLKLLSNSP